PLNVYCMAPEAVSGFVARIVSMNAFLRDFQTARLFLYCSIQEQNKNTYKPPPYNASENLLTSGGLSVKSPRSPINRRSMLVQHIYDTLVDEIVTGVLPPGSSVMEAEL